MSEGAGARTASEQREWLATPVGWWRRKGLRQRHTADPVGVALAEKGTAFRTRKARLSPGLLL